ncbi:HAMP domain-containing sensor histidine kinase [Paenibacillus qinlingensis]|uniref:sensor histidine kinase n=1 Tax=Paenibacillus qinlingensis TaxID=1837343 RepID=UPI00286AC65F|nr:HAMP domain-containing sensor histidine kinase [Paenibacillus qinlingensis]
MLRNREIRIFLGIMSVIGLCLSAVATLFSTSGAWLVFSTSALFIVTYHQFTKWRYRELEQLSRYLQQISNGDYGLDVRDNQEGELSLLKNDIYKVTVRLSEQNALLVQDKSRLKEAISDISHQIKTPLASMTVMTDLLLNPSLSEDKRIEFISNTSVQLERMDWLVSSLLKLSKIDAGVVTFRKEHIKVEELIRKAIQPILIPMDIKEQILSISGDKSASFTGDMNWTAEALINIMKNCVEHTPEGGALSITYTENLLYTEIIVEDTGKGISKDELPYILKRFYKGKGASEGSVGIGLSMSQSIISNQNGDIYVTSELGKGTQFQIRFYKRII